MFTSCLICLSDIKIAREYLGEPRLKIRVTRRFLEIVSNFCGISTIPSQNSGKVRTAKERNPPSPSGNCSARKLSREGQVYDESRLRFTFREHCLLRPLYEVEDLIFSCVSGHRGRDRIVWEKGNK